MQFRHETYTEVDYFSSPHNKCIKKGKILLLVKNRRKIHQADLLPCVIHKDSSSLTQFFVTIDLVKNDVAFILEPVVENQESKSVERIVDAEATEYSLILRLHNVSAMKDLDGDN